MGSWSTHFLVNFLLKASQSHFSILFLSWALLANIPTVLAHFIKSFFGLPWPIYYFITSITPMGFFLNNLGFLGLITTSSLLMQWRATVQELNWVGFALEFLLDHLREIAQALFMKNVQPVVDVIDAHIKSLKKEVADLEAHRNWLLSRVTGSSRFEDQTLISGLWLNPYSLCSFIRFPHVYFFW